MPRYSQASVLMDTCHANFLHLQQGDIMKRYAKFGDALSHTFAQRGETDDNGNPIEATGKPLSDKEYKKHKKEAFKKKLSRFRTRK
jgi:hypothetical protein